MDELYLDNIDEYINDQNKIVTYKWLSLTLGVHVNIAKQMLYHYLEQRRRETSGTTLHATYLVSGKCMENGNMCHKVSVVREDKLEERKSKLDVTVSVHVYSVQKAELKDSAPLYSTDYDAVKENLMNCSRYSSIRCPAAVPMSSAELKRVQKEAVITVTEQETSKINSTAPPPKSSSKQPKGIMGMFTNKAGSKSEEQKREVKAEQKDKAPSTEVPQSKAPAKAKAMNNFFGKSTEKKTVAVKTEKIVKEETDEAAKLPQASSTSPKLQQEGDDIKKENVNKATGVKKDARDTRSKTKRLELSDSDEEKEASQKKRRRIKNPQPDSSDDDEVIPDSPPAPEVNTPSPKKQVKKEPESQQNSEGRRRKRRRVLKSRTFLDDEGCMVTEKGYESESYSESDDDFKSATKTSNGSGSLKSSLGKKGEEQKAPEKTQKKAVASSNKATKQASIMGFFQKK